MASHLEVIHAYRHLYRAGLQAVFYAPPARFVLRDRLRRAFRKSHLNPHNFDRNRIRNTLQFLHGAKQQHTLEHKVIYSLIHTWYWQDQRAKHPNAAPRLRGPPSQRDEEHKIRDASFDHFNHLVRMLNESMGMCIR